MFGRLLTAMVTPFDESGLLDLTRLPRLIEHLIETGTTALVVAGTTGESPTLTHEEKLALFAASVEIVRGRIPVIAGTGNYATAETVAFSKEVAGLGVDGLLLVAPYYNRPSQEGLYRHFMSVADAVSVPVIVYNIPGRTAVNVSVETIQRLAAHPQIVAVKESTGDFTQISRLISETPENFLVYSGDDKYTLPVMALGGVGVVSVASHVAGVAMTQMITAAAQNDYVTARGLHHQLLPLFESLFTLPNPVPVKAALGMMGIAVGGVRLPLVDATSSELRSMRSALEQIMTLTPLH